MASFPAKFEALSQTASLHQEMRPQLPATGKRQHKGQLMGSAQDQAGYPSLPGFPWGFTGFSTGNLR